MPSGDPTMPDWGEDATESPPAPAAVRTDPSRRLWVAGGLLLVCVLAGATMIPSVRNAFLPGDDEYFVLNFSLVNRPTLSNVLRLFGVVHRDLYQPIPMLSYLLDTAVYGQRAWGFHLTNVLVHMLVTALVWTLVWVRWHRWGWATIAAGFMAVHPLAVEPVAMVTGRIVLLGVGFSMAAIVSFLIWSHRRESESGWLACSVLCTILAMMSKVQPGLPILAFLVTYGVSRRDRKTWWIVWAVLCVITAAFGALAVWTTVRSGMAEAAQSTLSGPLWGRALMALGLSLTHYVWPAHLSTWYLPPVVWTWWDARLLAGMMGAAVLVVVSALCYKRKWTNVGMGLVWYLAAILPFLWASAARNLVAADRYTYFANVGLHLVVGCALIGLYDRRVAGAGRGVAALMAVPVAVVIAVMGCLSVKQIACYRTGLAYHSRVAELHPDRPWVNLNVGWELGRIGKFDEAERAARAESAIPRGDKGRAEQLLGWIAQRRGQWDQAEKHYRAAVAMSPKDPMAHYRLGQFLDKRGRNDEAIGTYLLVLKIHAEHLPSLIGLAGVYERTGRPEAAVAALRRALEISPDYVEVLTQLGTIMLRGGALTEAERLYRRAIAVNPECIEARTNLAAILAQSYRQAEAIEQYDEVLLLEPNHIPARLSRAGLYDTAGKLQSAADDYRVVLAQSPGCVPALEGMHELLLRAFPEDGPARSINLWQRAIDIAGASPRLLAGLAWSQALAGVEDQALINAEKALKQKPDESLAQLTRVLLALHKGQAQVAIDTLESVCMNVQRRSVSEDLDRAARAIGIVGTTQPQNPLPYFLAGRILWAQGHGALASQMFLELERVAKDKSWADRVRRLMENRPPSATRPGGSTRPTTTPQTSARVPTTASRMATTRVSK